MKDLKLNKENFSTVQDDQLETIVGAAAAASCNRKSCGDGNGDVEVGVEL